MINFRRHWMIDYDLYFDESSKLDQPAGQYSYNGAHGKNI